MLLSGCPKTCLKNSAKIGFMQKPHAEPRLKKSRLAYTREEAAEALGQSPSSIDRLTKRGLLKPSRATRRPMYPLWELERFLRETTGELPR